METLSIFEDKDNPQLVKADRKLLLALVLVYSVIALLNLGTLNFPTSAWMPQRGDAVTLDFGEPVEIQYFFVNSNFFVDVTSYWAGADSCGGELRIVTDGGLAMPFIPEDATQFKWVSHWAKIPKTQRLTLIVEKDRIAINEVGFYDADWNLLPVKAVSEGGAELVDEQHTVPKAYSYFNGMYFDEMYHATTAYGFLHNSEIFEWTHPPLGKLIISIGIAIFGMVPFGWRVMGALFGIGMIPILYIFAKRIFRRTDFAFLAAAFFTFDCMHFTQTRIATVDGYAVFFILLMYLFMYDYMCMSFYDEPLKKTFKPLLLSGVFFGLGVAVKWICLFAGIGLAALFFWTLGLRFYERAKANPYASHYQPFFTLC